MWKSKLNYLLARETNCAVLWKIELQMTTGHRLPDSWWQCQSGNDKNIDCCHNSWLTNLCIKVAMCVFSIKRRKQSCLEVSLPSYGNLRLPCVYDSASSGQRAELSLAVSNCVFSAQRCARQGLSLATMSPATAAAWTLQHWSIGWVLQPFLNQNPRYKMEPRLWGKSIIYRYKNQDTHKTFCLIARLVICGCCLILMTVELVKAYSALCSD